MLNIFFLESVIKKSFVKWNAYNDYLLLNIVLYVLIICARFYGFIYLFNYMLSVCLFAGTNPVNACMLYETWSRRLLRI